LRYYSLAENTQDDVQIVIEPVNNPNKCDINGCVTTSWDSKHPKTLSFETTVWGWASTGSTFVAVVIDYDKRTRHLTEHVSAWDQNVKLTDDTAIAAMLAQNGVTNQELQDRRDWLLYQQFLPDFLAAHPSIHYTATDWGDVTVSTDSFLS
jgi:hypothetical protein